MATSRRRKIIEASEFRLKAIHKSAGYLTDAGDQIFLGEDPSFGPDDPPDAIALSIPEDLPTPSQGLGGGTGAHIQTQLSILVLALVTVNTLVGMDPPHIHAENVIHDIKRAMELDDRTLGGLVNGMRRGATRAIPREEGSTIVGASVEYVMVYSEEWGKPEA